MKVTAFYYLDYPDCLPDDPGHAATKMYVEVGQVNDTTNRFECTYAFQVYTIRYVQEVFFEKHVPLVGRSILIVPELADAWMTNFLSNSVDKLDEWGEKM